MGYDTHCLGLPTKTQGEGESPPPPPLPDVEWEEGEEDARVEWDRVLSSADLRDAQR